jgi:CRISPR-associated protein Cmr3
VSGSNGTWRGFRLIPDDVLFFRDGRPATRGDDHYLASVFPPNPSTLYGALRTRRLLDEEVDLTTLGPDKEGAWQKLPAELRRELGEWGGFGMLEIRGPWLVSGKGEVLLPAPADLGVTLAPRARPERRREEPEPPKVERVARFLVSEPGEPEPAGHSHPLAPLHPFAGNGRGWTAWEPEAIPPRLAGGWYLTPAGFGRWAEGGAPEPAHFVHQSELWANERRVGVAMEDERRTGREGHLFTFGFVRLREGVALGFEARETSLGPDCRVRLGGEGRTCWLAAGPGLPATTAGNGRALRIAFATPTLSESGGWPPGFDGGNSTGVFGGTSVRLRAASLPGYTLIGGWDLARGAPKPLRRAIPAGAVASFAPAEGSEPLSPERFHGTNHAGYPEEHLARQGFGLVLASAEPQTNS